MEHCYCSGFGWLVATEQVRNSAIVYFEWIREQQRFQPHASLMAFDAKNK